MKRLGVVCVLFASQFIVAACDKEASTTKVVVPFEDVKDIKDPGKCYMPPRKEQSPQLLLAAEEDLESKMEIQKAYTTPTKKVSARDIPDLIDDIDFEWFELAINRQIKRYETKSLSGTIQLGTTKYPQKRALDSLVAMKELVRKAKACLTKSKREICFESFHNEVVSKFDIYQPNLSKSDPRYGEKNNTLFTGYYTPEITAKSKKSGGFKYAVYKKPNGSDFDRYTREQIDFDGALAGKNLELGYSDDLFLLYLLHVEGGGSMAVDTGKGQERFYISYDGTNKKSWNFIANYMYNKGYIKSKSIAAQRNFLEANPDKAREIYASCPSYVYFKKTITPPLGNDAVPLTDRRSIATDSGLYKFKGLIAFAKTKRAKEVWEKKGGDCKGLEFKEFSRFFLDQDTGGAIKGKGRVDMYFGEGEYAERASSQMMFTGELYFLMLKKGL